MWSPLARVYISSDSTGAPENELKCKVCPNLRQETGLYTPVLVGCRLPLWESDIGRNNLLGKVAPIGSRENEEGISLRH